MTRAQIKEYMQRASRILCIMDISSDTMLCRSWPPNVGIISLEVYFPHEYVEQSELEAFDGVSPGKYTIGLGQSKMGFCSDLEDIHSICLTVVDHLMTRNKLSYSDIGRLEVGTETIVDKSKSVKTVLMQLFEDSGNYNVEGVDTTNACFGGTSALFNALNWIESSAWDGRYALVVAGDIAVYASGNARCTGGAGAVAMLVGPNAPLIVERGMRGATFIKHVYDFYKPDLSSEYPTVDGKLSIQCYLSALTHCYKLYSHKFSASHVSDGEFTVDHAHAFIFHSPYCKLVQKSFARLFMIDFLNQPNSHPQNSHLQPFSNVKLEETYFNKVVETAFIKASTNKFTEKTQPSLLLANQVGNMYTPSLYGGLASHISAAKSVEQLRGQRIVLFSYGSGLASSMFSLRVTNDASLTSGLSKLHSSLSDLTTRLERRNKVSPVKFAETLKLREETHNLAPYKPKCDYHRLLPGTFYLDAVDSMHRRTYLRTPDSTSTDTVQNGES